MKILNLALIFNLILSIKSSLSIEDYLKILNRKRQEITREIESIDQETIKMEVELIHAHTLKSTHQIPLLININEIDHASIELNQKDLDDLLMTPETQEILKKPIASISELKFIDETGQNHKLLCKDCFHSFFSKSKLDAHILHFHKKK